MDQEYTPLDLSMLDLSTPLPTYPENFRSGFASLVGRPNAGKSTLTNAMVGQKVAITSNRPQTTRHTIRGIVHKDEYQLILVDTPGIHRPRTLLGERLNDLVAAPFRRWMYWASAFRRMRRSARVTVTLPRSWWRRAISRWLPL